jgi:hypothetical protein
MFLLPGLLQAQVALGRLYYTTSTGRAVSFRVVDAGAGRLGLAPETGSAERLRAFVLSHSGAESLAARGARTLADPVPAAWKGGAGTTDLLQNVEATFWRYAPGQVLPARFRSDGQAWQLLAADLPPGRRF